MKVRMSCTADYDSKYEWKDCFCQGGTSGIVLPKGSFSKVLGDKPLEGLAEGMDSEESYITAFFEAFPKSPSCFLRGEGSTIEKAEEDCWKRYQKVRNCKHEMERRDRTDGYAYCKHCSYSSTVFEPLTKCCKCGYTTDHKGNYYCKKHGVTKPKNPNPSRWEIDDKRLPRKRKKLLKKCVTKKFNENNIFGKVTYTYKLAPKFTCNNRRIDLLFKRHEKELIKKYNKN